MHHGMTPFKLLSATPASLGLLGTTPQVLIYSNILRRVPHLHCGHFESLRTTYRSGKALGWSAMGAWKHEVFFGWNLGADASGTIAVGDELKVTRTRTAPMAA